MMCKVDPNNISILRSVAGGFLLCGFISIVLGKTYCKRTITRIEEPISFWGTVAIYLSLGIMMLLGTYVCQH
ncbi:hypothetical protein [Legionella sp. WA2024007413]